MRAGWHVCLRIVYRGTLQHLDKSASVENISAAKFKTMFRITVVLLLCAAIFCTQMPDIFEGCVRYNRKHEEPHKCTFEPRSRIRGNASFKHFAHLALKDGKIQPTSGQLNTLLRLTRVATQNYRSLKNFSVRLEFKTTPSRCNTSQVYDPHQCLPLGERANGVCQASFQQHAATLVLQNACCKPQHENRLRERAQASTSAHRSQPYTGVSQPSPSRHRKRTPNQIRVAKEG
ncbi:uncharacterized protein LOC119375630 [Rhipicephalus sanguineus]|uniref:uncharacterized protein LOC119375630 n=1 Tax=Rhipicephalus sanguineus TaxID=34632 RepID=UPI0020C3B63E|nr:uncharacterized protein LOC119375630 [Rhipicephalus sanguineus]